MPDWVAGRLRIVDLKINNVVFLFEEPSEEAMLMGLLPRLLPEGATVRYVVFEGKSGLGNAVGLPTSRLVID